MKKSSEKITPFVSSTLEPGAILEASWGWEQTNIQFYCVLKVAGNFATMQEMKRLTTGGKCGYSMTTEEVATVIDENEKPFRRKIKTGSDGKPYFMLESYKYADLWDGKPAQATHYA